MQPDTENQTQVVIQAQRTWRHTLSRLLYIPILALVLCGLFFHMQKSARKNFDIEKSVMKPQMISTMTSSFATHYKKYFSGSVKVNDSRSAEALFRTFEGAVRLYGLSFKRQNFVYKGSQGWNAYSFIPSRKENLYRCYVFAFNRKDPWSLVTMNVILDEFFSKDGNLGLSVVLLAADGDFYRYNYATKLFLNQMYSADSLVPECMFARDGINLEIIEESGSASSIHYLPGKIISWKRRCNV